MKAFICKNKRKANSARVESVISEIIERLAAAGIEGVYCDELNADCDLIIAVGGDGTILHSGKTAARLKKPLLGVNMGKLGFMTALETTELDKLEMLSSADWKTSSRMILDCRIGNEEYLALNDVVFSKDLNSKLPEFKVSINNETVSQIRADGLILSTSTGSTAYALSAGGPIIEPSLDCVEFTPLCAHTLFGRPMVFSAEKPVTVEFESTPGADKVFVSCDGEKGVKLAKGESAVVSKSDLRLELIELTGSSFYHAVHNKLMRPLK